MAKLSVNFPLIVEYTNSDYLDFVHSAFETVFNTKIKTNELGNIFGDYLVMFYIKKLPTDKELFKVLKHSKKFQNDDEIRHFMNWGHLDNYEDNN